MVQMSIPARVDNLHRQYWRQAASLDSHFRALSKSLAVMAECIPDPDLLTSFKALIAEPEAELDGYSARYDMTEEAQRLFFRGKTGHPGASKPPMSPPQLEGFELIPCTVNRCIRCNWLTSWESHSCFQK